MTDPLTHPGQLCAAGDRAVDLALELGQARIRLAAYEAQEARIRALHWRVPDSDPPRVNDGICVGCAQRHPCGTIAALDEPEAAEGKT